MFKRQSETTFHIPGFLRCSVKWRRKGFKNRIGGTTGVCLLLGRAGLWQLQTSRATVPAVAGGPAGPPPLATTRTPWAALLAPKSVHLDFFFFNVRLFLRNRESVSGRETEREGDRIRNRLQALSHQPRA